VDEQGSGGYRPQDGLGGPPRDYGQGPQYGAPQYGPPPQPYGPPSGSQWAPQGPPPSGQPWGPTPQPAWTGGPDQVAYPGGPTGLGPVGPAPRRSRARVLWTTVAAGTAVVLTAGGVYAYTALSGTSAVLPATVPADAVAYLEVNLDPPAGQKVAAIRFLRKFPDAKVGSDSGSLLDSVVEPLIADPADRKLFVENIKPWLGKHVAVAGDPQGGKVQPVIVAQTTDAARTRSGLDRFNTAQENDKDRLRYTITDGVVYLAETQAVADTAAKDAGAASLEGNSSFGADVDAVGDGGIVTFWADLAKAAEFQPDDQSPGTGRLAGSLTFTDSTADLVVKTFGGSVKTGTEVLGGRVAKLPQDTALAVGVSGADELVRQAYEGLEKVGLGRQLRKAEEDSGLDLPEDAAALVGSSTVFAVGGSRDEPAFGIVSKTADPARARRAAETLVSKLGEDGDLAVETTPDGTVLASSAAYASALTGDGGLGGQDRFKAALPDVAGATAVVYVDVERLAGIGGEQVPRQAAAVKAFGLTATTQGADATLHVRLVAG
jgi:hypothetical protein